MQNYSDQILFDAWCIANVDLIDTAIKNNVTNFNSGLCSACRDGHITLAELMIANGATCFNKCLYIACENGHAELAKLMIANGATCFNKCLYIACENGHAELAKLMINRGADDFESIYYYIYSNNQNIREFVKALFKLRNREAVPIIKMLRQFIKYSRSTKRIQRWWRGTYPLWRELAYAPPKGLRYRQAYERFLKSSKSKI